jgi:enoyl-[acyl-carrier protein] reductase II
VGTGRAGRARQHCRGAGQRRYRVRGVGELREQWARLSELTDRPFAINHTGRPFAEEVFGAILDATPAAISFHMRVSRSLVARAHEACAVWIQQVGDVRAAEMALEAEADVLAAQGWGAGARASLGSASAALG